MKRYIEIRPCAGGKESEILCDEMYRIYFRVCEKMNIDISVPDDTTRTKSFIADGKDVSIFDNEAGVHKFQRVAKTEKNGRVQTSTISVIVLPIATSGPVSYSESDVVVEKIHCQGKGGQNVNKVESGIRLTHVPTGIVIVSTTQRSQLQNKAIAFEILQAKLAQRARDNAVVKQNASRNAQLKSGDRSDARRVYNEQRGEVVDRITGKRCQYKEFVKGHISLLA